MADVSKIVEKTVDVLDFVNQKLETADILDSDKLLDKETLKFLNPII